MMRRVLKLIGQLFGGHGKLIQILRDVGIALLVGALGAGATALASSNPALAVGLGAAALVSALGLEIWLHRRARRGDAALVAPHAAG